MTTAAVEATAEMPPNRPSPTDRLNPILVREVQQAVKGRLFTVSVMLTLLIAFGIAVTVVGEGGPSAEAGRLVFDAGLATLVPLLLFVVPMQAYHSMRLELRAGILDQLLLTRLRPRAIVAGKLLAAMVQFVLYVSILAPLLATSYLLRGVDVPMIAVSIVFVFVACVAATAVAIAAAAQGVMPLLRPVAQVIGGLGFGLLTFVIVVFVVSGEYARETAQLVRSPELVAVVSAIVVGAAAVTVLAALGAQSLLLHPSENRSTGFRVFLFALPLLAVVWNLVCIDPADQQTIAVVVTFVAALVGLVFGMFMWTEQRELSPRMRAHVPRNGVLALLSAPFLPGRDRGVACLLLFFALLAGIAVTAWPVPATRSMLFGTWYDWRVFMQRTMLRTVGYTAAYSVIYLSIVKWIRGRLPASPMSNHAARVMVPLLLWVFCLGPVLFDVFVFGKLGNWHVGHAMNPFWTIDRFAGRNHRAEPLIVLGAVAAGLLLLQARGIAAGFREVLAASAARRAPAAKVAADG